MLFVFFVILAIAAAFAFFFLQKKKEQELARLNELAQQVNALFPAAADELFNILLQESHYFRFSEKESFMLEFDAIASMMNSLNNANRLSLITDSRASEFLSIWNELETKRTLHNSEFCQNELSRNEEFFNTVLKYPLDAQQRESIVKLEDNCLVVSSAGSGKTSTLVGKTKYLVEKQGVKPEDILIITYTRKASIELSERLYNDSLPCVTFHKLAMEIIAQTTGRYPSIATEDIFLNVFYDAIKKEELIKYVVDYVERYQTNMKDAFEYTSAAEYYADRKKYGIQSLYSDMDGHFVFTKSEEEKQICNFLTHFGLKFRYEEPYEKDTYTHDYRQYKPDFSIYYTDKQGQTQRIYLEHFGIDKNGNVPRWFGDGVKGGWSVANAQYREGIQWKKQVHKENNTSLIFTTSAEFKDEDIEERLRNKLIILGVPIKDVPCTDLLEQIQSRDKSLEKSLMKMTQSFIMLMKSNRKNLNQVLDKAKAIGDRRNIFIMENIIRPIYEDYENTLSLRHEIDFTDAIIQATELCEKGGWTQYQYILVDEFQDISIDRYHFLLALRGNQPQARLYCVGDDWQSIYRFAGSDMSLFAEFKKYFGFTEICKIETSYRFGNPLIEKSSSFIQQNPLQQRKNVKSLQLPNGEEPKTDIEFVACSSDKDVKKQLEVLVANVPSDKSIYILGRYTYDANILDDKNGSVQYDSNRSNITVNICNKRIPFLTVHSSKGLEADYVFLINCNSGIFGFPSMVSDDPVLNYVLSEADQYEYGEERRVFYVGLTRAKIKTTILYEQDRPSPFVTEMLLLDNPLPPKNLCPVCKDGYRTIIREGTASNGNHFIVWGCSNKSAGCSYFEREFKNQPRTIKSKF